MRCWTHATKIMTAIGLTPEEAKALVAYREKHGDYREWGEMLVVYGVDGRKLQAAKDKMSLLFGGKLLTHPD